MNISITKTEGGINIIRPQGKLISGNLNNLSMVFDDLLESDTGQVILNFKDVNIIDSNAVGLLVNKLNEFRKKGVSFRLCNLRSSIKQLFKNAGLEKLFEIHESEDEAVSSINGKVKTD